MHFAHPVRTNKPRSFAHPVRANKPRSLCFKIVIRYFTGTDQTLCFGPKPSLVMVMRKNL